MPRNGGSDDRNGRNLEQVGVVATVAAAAAVGALVVGAVSALGNFFSEEPQTEVSSTTRRDSSSNRSIPSGSSSSRSRYRCEEEDEDDRSAKQDALEIWLQEEAVAMVTDKSWAAPAESEGLTCKICFDRRISHVLECGHTLCRQCAVNIVEHHSRLCPFDRTKVTKPPQRLFV